MTEQVFSSPSRLRVIEVARRCSNRRFIYQPRIIRWHRARGLSRDDVSDCDESGACMSGSGSTRRDRGRGTRESTRTKALLNYSTYLCTRYNMRMVVTSPSQDAMNLRKNPIRDRVLHNSLACFRWSRLISHTDSPPGIRISDIRDSGIRIVGIEIALYGVSRSIGII